MQLYLLEKKAKELKILIFATVCFIEDVVPLTKMGFDSFKIASADCDFFPLLKSVSEAKIPIQLDTGSSTIDEISKSVDYLKLNNCSDIIIHHCPSGYPAREDSIDLQMIKTLRDRYDGPIGYSGHEASVSPSVIAAAMGAAAVERHITLDRTMWGTDQSASIEPTGMYRFVRDIRNIEKALGDGIKKTYESEIEVAKKLRYFNN